LVVTPDTNESDASTRIGRREYLILGALTTAGLAGCSSDNSTAGDRRPERNTATGTTSLQSPAAVTRQFYTTLYGEDDIDGTNALYHPDSPSPPLEAANFEAYGGLESIHTDIQSVAVVSQDDGRATVHVDVRYTLPDSTNSATDYMYLRQSGDEWRIDNWLPEALRRRFARGTVERFYDTLYNQNDIDAANAMYHPDSTSGPLEASSFEPYGGLENIETEIQSTELVAEGDGEAEIHADVEYATPNGTNTATDYVFLKLLRGSWKIDRWVPEAVREQATDVR
jgi:hypothetical protein